MTYAILIQVKTSNEVNKCVSYLRDLGLAVSSSTSKISNTLFIVVKFGASYSGVKNWMQEVHLPMFYFNGEIDTRAITLRDLTYIDILSNTAGFRYRQVYRDRSVRGLCDACGQQPGTDATIDPITGKVYCRKCIEGWKYCIVCGNRVPSEDFEPYTSHGAPVLICKKCFAEVSTTCSYCGNRKLPSDLLSMDGHKICDECSNDTNIVCLCTACHTPHLRSSMITDNETFLCGSCSRHYAECNGCRKLINRNDYPQDILDGSRYCKKCIPPRKFFGDNRYVPPELDYFRVNSKDIGPYFGLEIEMTNGNRLKCLGGLKAIKELWCKRDGSIDHSSGIELVTYPCTYEYFISKFPWKDVLSTCISSGYVSHVDTHCGLHIHIDRNALRPNVEVNSLRIVWIMNRFWREFRRFSRRQSSNLDRWAMPYTDIPDPEDDLERAVHHIMRVSSGCRYMCVNLQPHDTIELRLFRGSLNLETIIAALQLTKVLVDLKDETLPNVVSMTWKTFYHRCKEYPELIAYMNRVGITERGVTKDVDGSEEESNRKNELVMRSLNDIMGRRSALPSQEDEHSEWLMGNPMTVTF